MLLVMCRDDRRQPLDLLRDMARRETRVSPTDKIPLPAASIVRSTSEDRMPSLTPNSENPIPRSPASSTKCASVKPRSETRGRLGGNGSRTVPPPIVVTGEKLLTTKRSPPRATRGRSRRSRARPVSPGAIARTCATRASTSAVPRCTRMRVRTASGFLTAGKHFE
jgi:hypothetical protein